MNGFQLSPAHGEPTLFQKDGLLVHHGTDAVDIDIAARIGADRDRPFTSAVS